MRCTSLAIARTGLAALVSIAGCGGPMPASDGGARADSNVATDGGAGDSNATTDASPSDVGTAPTDAGGAGSAGCGQAATIATGTWVTQNVTVAGAMRPYFVRLPMGYDPMRRYPVIYQFHGCSDSPMRETNNVPIERASANEAILVRGRAAAMCWDTAATGPDVPYFDAMVPSAEATFCADTTRRFAAGYSSGSFMTHVLGCIRGNMLRGVASIAGGQVGRSCQGPLAALLIHDANDNTVNINASVQTRDSIAMRDGCSLTAPRTATDHPPCEAVAGCNAHTPVVWCQTAMQDHSRQDALAAPVFWWFLSSLAP